MAVAGDDIVDGPEYTEAEPHWVAPEKQELHWENWDEQYVLYDARSGETHLLKGQIARLLQQLVVRSGTAREVISRLLKQLERDGKIELFRGKIKITGLL